MRNCRVMSAEDRFLLNRQQRESVRAAVRDTADTADSEARLQFGTAVTEFSAQIEQLVEGGADSDDLMNRWREMQGKIADAVQTMRLTAYEIKAANAALANALNKIESGRSKTSEVKRFRFTRGTKPLGTSFSNHHTGDALGRVADRCTEDGETANAIADVTDSRKMFTDASTARFVRRCRDCTLLFVPVNGSCFISDCHNCVIYVACHQLRINNCNNCEVYAWCRSTPVIEKSTNMRFGGYEAWRGCGETLRARDGALTSVEEYAKDAGLDDLSTAAAAYRHVADFSWLRQQSSPNWTALPESEWKIVDTASPE
jgi:hypothetical protein